ARGHRRRHLQQRVELLEADETKGQQIVGQLPAPLLAALRGPFQVGGFDNSVGYEQFFKPHLTDLSLNLSLTQEMQVSAIVMNPSMNQKSHRLSCRSAG